MGDERVGGDEDHCGADVRDDEAQGRVVVVSAEDPGVKAKGCAYALQTATPGPYPIQLAIYALAFVPIALFALYLVRRHRKMVKWRAQQVA